MYTVSTIYDVNVVKGIDPAMSDVPCNSYFTAVAVQSARIEDAMVSKITRTVVILQHTERGNIVVKTRNTWYPVIPPPASSARVIPVEFKTAA